MAQHNRQPKSIFGTAPGANNVSSQKVLEIGIIMDGKLVQDREIRPGEAVTVGTGPKNTFVFPRTHLPSEFVLFAPTPRGYELHFTEQMAGRVQSGNTPVSLKKIAQDPTVQRKDGFWALPLTELDRGQITVDNVKVLFKFVQPAPKGLPLQDFRPRLLEEDDPLFFGFLGLWTALGVVLAIWVWVSPPREVTLDDLPEQYVRMIIEVPEERTPEPVPDTKPEEPTDAESEEPKPEPETPAEKTETSRPPQSEAGQARAEAQRKSELIGQNQLLLKFVGTAGESRGGVVENLWGEDGGLGNLAQLQEATSVTTDAALTTRGGNAGGAAAAKLGEVNQIGGGKASNVAAIGVSVKPKVNAGQGWVDAELGDEDAVKGTVDRYSGQLQYCYEKVLKIDPTLDGRIEVRWKVADGLVVGMPVILANTTNNAELADCVVKKIRRWEFPQDVKGDMSWPFLFQQKK